MDPVSVFTSLFDTKCVSFAQQQEPAANPTTAPYHIDLRRMSLHSKLLSVIVSQVADKYLTSRSLLVKQCESSLPTKGASEAKKQEEVSAAEESDADSHLGEELETSSRDDDEWEKVDQELEPIIYTTSNCGAMSLAAAVAFKAQLPLLVDDNKRQKLELVEAGQKVSGQRQNLKRRVILIEDVIKSGEPTLETIRKIELDQKFKVQFVICIVDCDENGIDRLEQEGVRVISLYNMGAILRILEITGRITNEQYNQAKQWIARNAPVVEPHYHNQSLPLVGRMPCC